SEKRIQKRLDEARELNKTASALAGEARAFERERNFDKALAKWEDLRRLYADYPDLDRSIAHVRTQQEQMLREAREKWASDIQNVVERGDYERAANLAQQARREFPQVREFTSREEEIRGIIERRTKAEKQLASAEKFAEKAKWTQAAESFGLALEAGGSDAQIRGRVFQGLVQSSHAAVSNDLEAAELLLGEAARVEPNSPEFGPIRKSIQDRKQALELEACLKSVARSREAGNLDAALQEIERGLAKYPNDSRLLRQRNEIEEQARKLETEKLAAGKISHRRAPTEEFRPLPKSGPPPTPPSPSPALPAKLEAPSRPAVGRTAPSVPTPPAIPSVPASTAKPPAKPDPMVPPDSLATMDHGPAAKEMKAAQHLDAPRTEMLNLSDDLAVFLKTVEKELAVFLGPLARVVVKRAAAKTTDVDEMFRIIAQSLERDEDRDAFLARRVELEKKGGPKTMMLTSALPKPAAPSAMTSAINPMTALGITPEAVEHAARALAAHVGPISSVLAKKAAQRADSLRSLYVLLSQHVQNGKDRRQFLRDAGFPDA
ncbi:MAG TPA: hypothetical protein VK466_07550, partial [Terriglobales bacterium]|nr:hypothetical protein [Terriglobales bacterium]